MKRISLKLALFIVITQSCLNELHAPFPAWVWNWKPYMQDWLPDCESRTISVGGLFRVERCEIVCPIEDPQCTAARKYSERQL